MALLDGVGDEDFAWGAKQHKYFFRSAPGKWTAVDLLLDRLLLSLIDRVELQGKKNSRIWCVLDIERNRRHLVIPEIYTDRMSQAAGVERE